MVKTAICGRSARGSNRHITTPTEGRSGHTARNLHVVAKTLLVMKLTVLFLMAGFLNIYAKGVSQNVSFSGKSVSLESVFISVEKQTGFLFLYTEPVLRSSKPVSVRAENRSLEDFLKEIFESQPLEYVIRGKSIFISPKVSPQVSSVANELTLASIRGKVLDEDGQPLVGATITVRHSKSSAVSNADGMFTINANEGDILVITYVEHQTREVKVTSSMISGAPLSITLSKATSQLQETVITGIFNRKAGSFSGASRTMTGAELKKVSSNNVFAAIAALDPAFRIVPNNVLGGNINQLPEIQMRGQNSFPNLSGQLSGNPNAPLFILDGFEVSLQRIADLDMNLISSITLLKDASATAIYGSRGANGIMVVTTVVPQSGRIQVTFNNDFRFTTPDLSVYDLLDARDKLNFEQRAGVYTDGSNQLQNKLDVLYAERYKAMVSGVNTNWLALPVRNGYSNRSSLYLQGGDQTIRYGLQFSGDLASGVMKGQNRNNYSGQFDLNYVVKRFQFSNSIRIFQNKANESPYGDFSKYVGMNPYWAPYDEKGKAKKMLEDYLIDNTSFAQTNPLYDASLHSVNSSQYFGLSNNLTVRYTASPAFYLESRLSLNKQNASADQFYSAEDSRFIEITDLNRKGSYTARSENTGSYQSLTTANLSLNFGPHQIFSNIGFDFRNSSSEYYSITAEGFPYDRLDNLLFAAQYQANGRPTGDESTVRSLGLIYSGSYTYDNRFFADVSFRRDGSSQYGSEKRFGTFWSTGVGWNIHNEKFFQKGDVVNRLKIRASYGPTGSQNLPAYASQFRYNFGTSTSYFGELGSTLIGLGNENLSWQNVYKGNVGADVVLFKEKLDLRVDFYRENTRNALTTISLAPSTGFTSYSENLGQLQNTGFEFSLRYKLLENASKGMLWSVNVNGFTNKNILKELSNKLKASNDIANKANTDQVIPNVLFQEGEALNTIYVVRSLGVDPVTGSEIYLTKSGEKTFTWNAADKVAFGIAQPKWNGNFGSNFMYKGFDLSLIFNYQFGGQLYNQTLIDRVESVNPAFNVDRRAYDLGWSGPGDVSRYTRIGTSTSATRLTSRFVQDDDNLTLSSASIGYNFFRTAFIKRLGMRSLQVTAITNDLFRVSTIQIERGTSNPFARTYSLSLRVGF